MTLDVDPLELVDPARYAQRGYPHAVWTRLRAEAHAIRRELGLLYRDVERLSARVGSLDRHFAQAQKDVEEIRISADKAQGRARRLEAIDFAPEAEGELPRAAE